MTGLDKIQRRQVARLIDHLKDIGYNRPELFQAVKRSYGYTFEDIKALINTDTTRNNEHGDDRHDDI
jgi:hypothetical protein